MALLDHITHWRAQILARLLLVVFVLGLATAVPSIILLAHEGKWSIVILDVLALVWLAGLWRRRSLAYRTRAYHFLALTFLVGVGLLLKVGPVSQIYLMAVPVLAALLLGQRPAVWSLLAATLCVLVLGYEANARLQLDGMPDNGWLKSGIVALNFLFIGTIVTLSSTVLIQHLTRSLDELHATAGTLDQLASFDPLTGLPNRRLLLDRLHSLIASSQRSQTVSAVLFIDLDRFKFINDARGHVFGDALLKSAAERLGGLVRKADTVARIGGDEFVVLLTHLSGDMKAASTAAQQVAEKIRLRMADGFEIQGQSYLSSASIGVSLLPRPRQTADDLLREADTAMYRAKASGRNAIAFFEEGMQADVQRRLAMERDLGAAIEQDALCMHFQPQVDRHGRVLGAELLMRWPLADGSMVPPAVFIPLAEESGQILRLGQWALHQACAALRALLDAGHELPLSVNVSPQQFRQPDFVEQVRNALQTHGVPARHLLLEVTEGLLVEKMDETIARMNALAAMGLRFSIDDFGTGYSSLAYLKKMPLYELKIDKSFIQDTPASANDTAIVQAMLAMAHHLQLRVVAEGVETAAQAQFLAESGCHLMQGYLFARPAPLSALFAMLARQTDRAA